jgi:hypothetical protein
MAQQSPTKAAGMEAGSAREEHHKAELRKLLA